MEGPCWEGFLDDLKDYKEVVPECPVNENVRGDEGWKFHEMGLLADLVKYVSDKKCEEIEEVYERRMTKNGFEEKGLDKSDLVVERAIQFRELWNRKWSGPYGFFEGATLLHSMEYTYDYAPLLARPCDSLQIFSAKFMKGKCLQWPLHVFGMVAVRDLVDRSRNHVFYRSRDNCQTLTETDPYLVLTGPTRAVVITDDDHVIFEIYLKVRGNTEDEDEYLIYWVDQLSGSLWIPDDDADIVYPFQCHSNRGKLEIRFTKIKSSVEATIFVRVIKGSWPDGFHGHFVAQTSSEHQDIVLFDFEAEKTPVDADGFMKLSRQVVSVELEGSLKIHCMAWRDDKSFKACLDHNEILNSEVQLKPGKAGRVYASLHLGSCVMEVIVAWSLVLPEPQPAVPDSALIDS